jgi:hypothetical protein
MTTRCWDVLLKDQDNNAVYITLGLRRRHLRRNEISWGLLGLRSNSLNGECAELESLSGFMHQFSLLSIFHCINSLSIQYVHACS